MLKIISKKLDVTKRKVSRHWQSYRKTKLKVTRRKNITSQEKSQILNSERDKVYQKISKDWSGYREKKELILYKSPYPGFKLSNKLSSKTSKTIQKVYKARKYFNTDKLDGIVPKILNEPNVKGVLIVFRVESEETGQYSYISNYITKQVFKRLQSLNQSVYQYVVEKFKAGNTKDYHLKFIYLRIIYAKT